MCSTIDKNVRVCKHFSFHESRCGNKILDDGEQCDSDDKYCTDCRLKCPADTRATARGTCAKVTPKSGPGDGVGNADGGASGGGLGMTVGIVCGAVVLLGVGYKVYSGRKGGGGDDIRMPRTQRTVDALRDDEENETSWLLNPIYKGAQALGLSKRKSN